MKSRLAASIYPLSAGTRRRNIRNAISPISMVTFFGRRHCQINCSFQAQAFESSSRAVHSSAIEDEAFSELGPEISECSAKQIKLVTEKPDHYVKIDPSKRELAGKPLSSDTRSRIMDIVGTIGRASPTSKSKLAGKPLSSDIRPRVTDIVATIGRASPNSKSKLGGHSHASTSTNDTKKDSDIELPGSVSIKNIHSTVGLSELVEAISVFGKVSGASFATAPNGLRGCNIEFENVDSSRRAILAGKIAVGNQVFPVQPLDAVTVVTVRIKNINEETTDYAIHSRCKSVGELVGLARTSKDVVDAFFNIRNDAVQLNILKKLNKTAIDSYRWSAHVLKSNSTSSEVSSDESNSTSSDEEALGLQIFYHSLELRRQLALKKVYLEDLETLNASIMHIESLRPATYISGSK